MGKRVTDPRLLAALRARQETTLPANITDESIADLDLNGPPVMHGPGFASPEQDAEMAGYAYDKQRKERAYVGPPMGMGEAAIQKGIEGATLGFNDVAGGVMGAAKQAIAPDYMTENSPLGDRLKFGYRQGHDSVTMANVRAGDALGPLSLPVEMAGGIATGGPVMKGAKALLAPIAKRAPAVLAPFLGGDAAAAGLAGGVAGYGASEDPMGGVIGSIFAGGGTAAMGSEAAKNLAGKARNEASEKWAKVIGSTGGQKADIDRAGGIDAFRELGRWGRDRVVEPTKKVFGIPYWPERRLVNTFDGPEKIQARLLGQEAGNADKFDTLLPDLQAKVDAAGRGMDPAVQFNMRDTANATRQAMGAFKRQTGAGVVDEVNNAADGISAKADKEIQNWLGREVPASPIDVTPRASIHADRIGLYAPGLPAPAPTPMLPGNGGVQSVRSTPIGPQPREPLALMPLDTAHDYNKGVAATIRWGGKDPAKIAENSLAKTKWGIQREELSSKVGAASREFDPSAAPAWENLLNDSKQTFRGLKLADDGVARRAGFRFLGLGPTMAAAGGNPWLAAGLKAVQSFGNGVAGWGLDKAANSLARGASPNKWIAGGYQAGDLLDSIIDEDNRKKLGQ